MAFCGTQEKCKACDKTVHIIDMVTADGISYHKICFKCSHCNGKLVTRTPSKFSTMFCGTQDKCTSCKKTVYPLEKVTVEGESFHKTCFRCSHGGCLLTTSSYAALDGILYCKSHFAQLFKEKGCYNHLTKTASQKKIAAASADQNPEAEATEAKEH
ncbi:LIM domain-containing protein PLIM2b [Citrus sinensis]|nr:LIM domain-containing protein PLIM2b [Citrus sinensis]